MSECYMFGGDTWQPLVGFDIQAQTFTPLENHIANFIDVDLWLFSFTPPWLEIRECDSSHEPIGPRLSLGHVAVPLAYLPPAKRRVRYQLDTALSFARGTIYSIWLYKGLDHLGADNQWLYDKNDATYPRGHIIFSDDGGHTWTHFNNHDFMFCEFGNPPLPKPDPVPPIAYWSLINIGHFHWPSTITITLPTSVPCHLTCYYTEIEPRKHPSERTIRGASVPWGTYFCFVAWKEVEQTEVGDTLYHTFEMPNWSFCQTKWFTFRGTIAQVPSPSIGPIFKHHHTGMLLFQNGSFSTWPDPNKLPAFWLPRHSGPGGTLVVREQTNVHDPPYAAKLIATQAGTSARLRQVSGVIPYRGQSLTISVWYRTIGWGQPRLSILIGPAPYEGVTFGTGPGPWRNFTRTFPIHSHHYYLTIEVGTRATDPSVSTSVFDEITVIPS